MASRHILEFFYLDHDLVDFTLVEPLHGAVRLRRRIPILFVLHVIHAKPLILVIFLIRILRAQVSYLKYSLGGFVGVEQ